MTEHLPPVISQSCVVEYVWLDDPVHLQVVKVIGNTLIKALSDVGVVLRRCRLTVIYGIAALGATAVGDSRTDILVITIGYRELVVELMIETEQPSSDVNLVVVVGASAKTIRTEGIAIKCWGFIMRFVWRCS